MKRESKDPLAAALLAATGDEATAVALFEQMRWGGEPRCPRCESKDVYAMRSKDGTARETHFRWRCHGCRKAFSVRTATVMEESRVPLRKWAHAFWRACSSKKGVSALQVSRETGVSYKSALYLMHRVRFAMGGSPTDPPLRGTIEADETYVGGKPRWTGKKAVGITGRGTDKVPVAVLVERDGEARLRLQVMRRVTALDLGRFLVTHADGSCHLMTDDFGAYRLIGKHFESHDTVNHSRRQYAKGEVHSNTAESVFSLIKRGLMGTFHSVSKRHLPRYLAEFEFRWNTRKVVDGERVQAAVRRGVGKRLMYEAVVA